MKGKFHIFVDDEAKVFHNGKLILEGKWRVNNYVYQSKELEIASDDRILVQLKNAGKEKGLVLAFVSTDLRFLVSFKAADFKQLIDPKQKDFNPRDLAAITRTAEVCVPNVKNRFPFPNQAECVWGDGDVCVLAGQVKKEMIQPLVR
jgi:hypothetical protein